MSSSRSDEKMPGAASGSCGEPKISVYMHDPLTDGQLLAIWRPVDGILTRSRFLYAIVGEDGNIRTTGHLRASWMELEYNNYERVAKGMQGLRFE